MKPSSRRKAAPVQPAMVSVTLKAEHEHLGSLHQPGAEISVHPDTAQWLEAMGVAAPAPSTPQTAPQPVNTKD